MNPKQLGLGIAIGAVAATASVAAASIPDANGIIHGCYSPAQNGALRITNPSKTKTCAKGELAVSWSQSGATGATGPQGLKGDTGAQGIQGAQGIKGDTGAQGVQGVKGDEGPKGDQGPKGDAGSDGQDGAAGRDGTSIVARLTVPGPIQTSSINNPGPTITPNPDNWTQGATELDQMFGQMTLTAPKTCGAWANGGATQDSPQIWFNINVVGTNTAISGTVGMAAGTTRTVTLGAGGEFTTTPSWLFEPGTDTARTVHISAGDNCYNADESATITNLQVDVIAAR